MKLVGSRISLSELYLIAWLSRNREREGEKEGGREGERGRKRKREKKRELQRQAPARCPRARRCPPEAIYYREPVYVRERRGRGNNTCDQSVRWSERMTELSEEESYQPSRQPAVQMLLFIVAQRQLDLSCEPAIAMREIVA